MGSYETRDDNIPIELLPRPNPGPTLIDFYFPDHDRHVSGLNCYEFDHYRGLYDHDDDIKPLQYRQDPEDHLTDSESDEDDAYNLPKPTISHIRKILNKQLNTNSTITSEPISPPGKMKGKELISSPPPTTTISNVQHATSTNISLLSPNDIPDTENINEDSINEQVELLRDRKILDMESYLIKLRQKTAEDIATRLESLSSSSICLFNKLPVQFPFHMYEDHVYSIMENRKPVMTNTYIEPGALTFNNNNNNTSKLRNIQIGDDMSIVSKESTLKSPISP